MASRINILRIGAIAAMGIIGAVCLLVLSIYAILGTETGREHLVVFLNNQWHPTEGDGIGIQRLSGNFPHHVVIEGVTLHDKEGEWFRLDAAKITWRPAKLFKGDFHITDLKLSGLHMERFPVGGSGNGSSASGSGGMAPPLTIIVDSFTLKNASLGAAVLGERVMFGASGETTVEIDGLIRTTLDLNRTDGMAGHARLEGEFQPQSNRLGIRLAWQEPRGGTVARALELPGLPSLSIHIRGDGTLDDWHGRLQARAGDLASLDTKVSLDVVNRSTLEIEGTADLGKIFDEPLQSLLSERITFNAAATYTDNQLALQRGTITTALGTVASSGKIQGGETDLRLTVLLAPRGISTLNKAIEPLSTTSLRLDAELRGPPTQPAMSVEVTADAVTFQELSASHFKGKFEIALQKPYGHPQANPQIQAKGQLTGIRIDPPELMALMGKRVEWQAASVLNLETLMIDIEQAIISTAVGRLSASGQVDAGGKNCDLKVSAGIGDLGMLSPLVHQPVTGRATFESRVQSSDLTQGFTAVLTGKLDDTSLGGLFTNELLGPQITITGALSSDAIDGWVMQELKVQSALAELTGSVALSPASRNIDGTYHLKIDHLADLSDIVKTPLSGRLEVEGSLGGTLDTPTLSGRIFSPALVIGSVDLGSLDARILADQLTNKPHGHATVSIRGSAHGDAHIETDYATLDSGSIQLSRIKAESGGTTISGTLALPLKTEPVTGTLSGRISSLAQWSQWIGRDLSGTANVEIILSEEENAPSASVAVDGKNLTIAVTKDDFANIDDLSASAKITRLLDFPTGRLVLRVKGAKLFDASIAESSVTCDINGLNSAGVRAEISGDFHGPFTADIEGGYSRNGEHIEWILSGLNAMFKGQQMALEKPARFTLTAGGTMSVEDLAIAAGNTRILAAGRVTDNDIGAMVEVTDFPLAAAEIVRPDTRLTGLLSGSVQLGGTRKSPTGQITLKAANILTTTSIVQDLPPTSALINGEWRNSRINLTAAIDGIAEKAFALEADLPLRLDPVTLAFTLPRTEEIRGKINWQGELEPIWNLLNNDEHQLKGQGDLSLDLAGSLNDLHVGGHLELIRGSYANISTGTTISDITLRIEGDRKRLVLKQFSAGDGGGGSIKGHGTVELDPAKNFPIGLEIDFKETLLAERDDLTATASGKLAINGSLAKILLSGEIIAEKVEWSLASNLPPDVVELEVEEVNQQNGLSVKNKNRNGGKADTHAFNMDLKITAPGQVFVRGMGLDSEWEGAVRIMGPANESRVLGKLKPVRGGFTLMGKKFELQHGSVRFPGGQEIETLFNLTAEYKAQEITAVVTLTGSASQPKIAITSRPPLPQAEIVSRVLFGKDVESLTPAQSIQVASAIATFSNVGGVGTIMATVRRAFGIDVFNFDSGEADPSETRISIGKYLSNGLYIGLEQGTGGDSQTAATVEMDVISNVKVEGGTTERGSGKMGVKWRWDY